MFSNNGRITYTVFVSDDFPEPTSPITTTFGLDTSFGDALYAVTGSWAIIVRESTSRPITTPLVPVGALMIAVLRIWPTS